MTKDKLIRKEALRLHFIEELNCIVEKSVGGTKKMCVLRDSVGGPGKEFSMIREVING